ncbi:MAG TPA: DUF5395 family protein [Gammaproteobacteria bacterium]|jgi:hypothetical protein|nr:DUF5395 family protein [Gammaproteobacteria bacterium]
MTAVEVELTYEHGRWRARGAGLDIVHAELRGIESQLEARLATPAGPCEVRLGFDMGALPRWLHQYHGHYCNYTLHVPPRGGGA